MVLISYEYGINSRNVGCMVCFFFRAFYLTSVRGECVPVEMVYVFDEISLTLNPD